MNEWHDFYVAAAGAAAALSGLIFVALSINLTKILASAALPYRAIVSLTMLIAVLIVSLLILVPNQPSSALGWEISVLGITVWLIAIRVDLGNFRITTKEYKWQQLVNLLFDQLSLLPYLVGGLRIIAIGEAGLYWIVLAVVFSFMKSTINAWILLVEINRGDVH